MGYEATVRKYVRDIQKEYENALIDKQHTAELSFRTQLHVLFRGLAHDLNDSTDISVILEPKNQGSVGRPDLRIHEKNTLGIFGYVEAKGPSIESFDISPYRKQIEKYLSLGHNLVITDGIDFVFCMKDKTEPIIVSMIEKSKMGTKDWSRSKINPLFEVYMRDFFATPSPQQVSEEKLVELVAVRTRFLADEILAADIPYDQAMNEDERKIIELFSGIKALVYNHNDPSLRSDHAFADFTAQVIMFSLLYAHRVLCLSSDSPTIKEAKIRKFITEDFIKNDALSPFRNLMMYLRDHSDEKVFINQWIDECIKFLSFVSMSEQQLLNPDYHRLFELYLSKYDTKTRFDYGAFYTPKSLANYIVQLVEYVVGKELSGASIYQNGNTIIDPCCGTGSFLEQIIRHDKSKNKYTLCGFEILPTPYMLANYRMAVVNKELNDDRIKAEIVLANTLSNGVFGAPVNLDTIEGQEIRKAKEYSSMPLKLIIGNPPSSDAIRENNTLDFSIINELIDDFRPPVEKRRQRQNIQKQVGNPFMQFIRWSCKMLLDIKNDSALAFVVPLSFLDAESYQYARKYLCENFSSAWIMAIDADGRTGVRTDSLFDTLQGRAVIIVTRKYGVENRISHFHFIDKSQLRKSEKEAFLNAPLERTISGFDVYHIDEQYWKLLPSEPIDDKLYSRFWPISDVKIGNAIFENQVSGIKLGATSILTNVKSGMLKRRTKDIVSNGYDAAKDWVKGSGQRVAQKEKVVDFQMSLSNLGNTHQIDKFISENIREYAFRPFLTSRVLLWVDLLQRWKDVGGGGTRYRKEIMDAYCVKNTFGFSVAHAPKDLNTELGQFVSFCWYYPDNDLSYRGNGHIYLNQFPDADGELHSNINERLVEKIQTLTGYNNKEAVNRIVFYTYGVLCSQVYLEKFRGALYVPNQSDARARIPIVEESKIFEEISKLGEAMARLEQSDHAVENLLGYDYEEICRSIPVDFKLNAASPFDEQHEKLILTDDMTTLEIHCPLHLQRFNVAGYDVIKYWLKFHQYTSTRCTFAKDDMKELLDFLNTLEMHIQYVGNIDRILQTIFEENVALIEPS